MKSPRVNPPYGAYSKGNSSRAVFRYGIPGYLVILHCAGVFLKDKNSCVAAWAVDVSKICAKGLDG